MISCHQLSQPPASGTTAPGKGSRLNEFLQHDGQLCRAAGAHGEHEKRIGAADKNWSEWYGECMMREQTGQELPT